MSFKLSKPDKFDTLASLIIGAISIFLLVIIIIFNKQNHYIAIKGESYYQNSNNNFYYVVIHDAENNDIKYEIETPSEIYAEQLSQFDDKDLFFSKSGYIIYNDEKLPYRVLK